MPLTPQEMEFVYSKSLLDVNAVCAKLGGISPATVYRMVDRGELPEPIRLGPRLTRWQATDIDDYIRNGKRGLLPSPRKKPRRPRPKLVAP